MADCSLAIGRLNHVIVKLLYHPGNFFARGWPSHDWLMGSRVCDVIMIGHQFAADYSHALNLSHVANRKIIGQVESRDLDVIMTLIESPLFISRSGFVPLAVTPIATH